MSTETESPLELVLFTEAKTSIQVFTRDGMDAILEDIEAKVRAKSADLDISTETGRAEVRSLAFQVRKTKVALDNEGKRLTELWRKQTTQVNEERKKGQDRLDALAEEVRKPLTDFEEKEKRRVAAHEEALRDMSGMLEMLQAHPDMTVALLEDHLLDLSLSNINRNWEEFADRATKTRRDVSVYLIGRIEARKAYDVEQAELARLRAEDAERQRVEAERVARERDARLQAEAAEVARLEAERLANQRAAEERQRVAAEAERVQRENEERLAVAERQRLADIQAAELLRQREEQARFDAEAQARDAQAKADAAALRTEEMRLEGEQRLEEARNKSAADAKKAREKANKDREEALQAERDRISQAGVDAEIERQRRAADEANKVRVRAEIIEDLESQDGRDGAEAVADLIMAGKVRNLKVIF